MRRTVLAAALLLALAGAGALLAFSCVRLSEHGERPEEARVLEGEPEGDAADEKSPVPMGERYESELALVDEAARVLEERASDADSIVVRSGYLDLSGKVWACVLQGEGSVEVLMVSESSGGAGSEVVSWSMDAEDAAALAGAG